MRSIAIALLICASTPAVAASNWQIELEPGESQQSRMINGSMSIDDSSPGSVVRVVNLVHPSENALEFMVFALNSAQEPFNLGPENVSIEMLDGSVAPALTYADMAAQERKRQKRQRFAMALAAMGRGMSAAGAGYQSGSVNYSGTAYNQYGTTNFNGTGTYSGYNAAAAQAAQANANAENARDIANMRERQEMRMAALDGYFRTTTIDPGKVDGGIVKFDIPKLVKSQPKGAPVVIVVTVNGETHRFGAIASKVK